MSDDNTQDAAEPSPASAGSRGPAAWAVMLPRKNTTFHPTLKEAQDHLEFWLEINPSRSADDAKMVPLVAMSDAEIDVIARWATSGAAEGDPAHLPPLPNLPDGWRLGTPDLEITMTEPYTLRPGGADVLRNFILPVPLTTRRWVRGLEFRTDNRRVVHHANIRIDSTGTSRQLDASDGEPGFDGRLNGGAEFPEGQFLGWTPGQLPPLLDRDSAWPLAPGGDLVVQLHMRPTERTEQVRIRIGFFFTDQAPRRTPVMVRLGRQDLDLAPGAADYRVRDSYRLPVPAQVLAIQPHAHYRAREVNASALLPDGTERMLLHIANWDFDWQDAYRLAHPLDLPAGSVLQITYRFDNSAGNPRNPDYPPRRVRWGQNSVDEMGDVWFQLVTPDAATRRRLVSDVGRKILTEDAVGFETLMSSDPLNARLHEAAAAILLALGDRDRGERHLEQALDIDPRSAEAHYNLATVLAWRGQTDAAIDHLQRALDLAPAHVGAHINLGVLLQNRGDAQAALAHLGRAVALAPNNPTAHVDLGAALMRTGSVTAALAEYRTAVNIKPDLAGALAELAWTLATSPSPGIRNPTEAVALARRADEAAGGTDLRVLDALAAAYASAGRFPEAQRTLAAARRLVPSGSPEAIETLKLLDSRQALYGARRPYIDNSREER